MESEIYDLTDTNNYDKALICAAAAVKRGGIAVFPTETVYGLGADAYNAAAVEKIFDAKGRPNDNPLIVHLSDPGDIFLVAESLTPAAEKAFAAFCPGPISIIVRKNERIPLEVTAGLPTVAVRIPELKAARDFIGRCGCPIAAPSANISGKPSPTAPEHVLHDMKGKADVILTMGSCSVGVESTVVDLSSPGAGRLYRPGKITAEEISDVTGIKIERAYTVKGSETPRSPGMKYRHYKPSGRVLALKGSVDTVAKYINARLDESAACVLSDDFRGRVNCRHTFYLGTPGDDEAAARGLFAALRACDLIGADVIYVTCTDEAGIGEAYMNRLTRAADEIIETDGAGGGCR